MDKYHIDPAQSYMVGDKLIDAESGKNAGVTGILVRHQHPGPFAFYKTLLEFAQFLKSKP